MNTTPLRCIDPTGEDIKRLATTVPEGAALVMLNLLRFREQAIYPAGSGFTPCSGREAYQRYSRHTWPFLKALGGEPLWHGHALARVIGPPEEDWDELLLVRYPSVGAFLAMLGDAAYQQGTVHRTAALADARLLALEPAPV